MNLIILQQMQKQELISNCTTIIINYGTTCFLTSVAQDLITDRTLILNMRLQMLIVHLFHKGGSMPEAMVTVH
jgi:uncharacterized UBP type Zn finger protein